MITSRTKCESTFLELQATMLSVALKKIVVTIHSKSRVTRNGLKGLFIVVGRF